MKTVLNISKHDIIGRRFNNLDAREHFLPNGWDPLFCCWTDKTVQEEYVVQANGILNRYVSRVYGKLAQYTGDLNGYHRNANAIKALDFYSRADLLHFHIVHEKFLSITDWLELSRDKAIVWTWHDPYMLSGHCIYSLDCDRFETGCQKCDHLDYHFPIKKDRSAINLAEKAQAVIEMDPLIIIASDYMAELVDRSVYRGKIRIKTIPFGVDLPCEISQMEAKVQLKIPEDHIVIGFRAVYSDYKGMPMILDALSRLASKYSGLPITVIAFQERNCCTAFSSEFNVIETGWIDDDDIYRYYSAMDYFLMPSRAEAFGLMAIEAMAAGACPIVTYGTALPELIGAPINGICVEHDDDAFYAALERAVLKVQLYRKSRKQRIEFAKTTYGMKQFSNLMAETYNEELEYCNSIRCSA